MTMLASKQLFGARSLPQAAARRRTASRRSSRLSCRKNSNTPSVRNFWSQPIGKDVSTFRQLQPTCCNASASGTGAKETVPAPAPWKWEDSEDAVKAYGVFFGILMLGQVPAAQQNRFFDMFYFISLAVLTIYIGAHRGLTTEQRQQLSIKEGLLAPVGASFALFGTYLIIKYLPDLSLQTFIDVYFWVLGTVAIAGATSPLLKKVYTDLGQKSITIPIPKGWVNDEKGEAVDGLDLPPTDAVSLLLGVVIATLDLQAHHMNFTLNNVLACTIATEILQLLGIRSFRTAGIMLVGLLAYDVFWVFGSSTVVGDNVMLTVATSDAIVAPTKLLFPKANPNPMAEAANFPFSLLGLGDIALPGLLACLSLRYDASRSTDMRARAQAAADAMTSALASLDAGASRRVHGDTAAAAAESAYDEFADREDQQRAGSVNGVSVNGVAAASTASTASTDGGSTSSSERSGAQSSSSGSSNALVPISDAVLYQRAYFTPVLVMYVVGLVMAFAANSITNVGQPALLYLVPCTLGAVCVTGLSRGELQRLWNFTDVASFGLPDQSAVKEDEKAKSSR